MKQARRRPGRSTARKKKARPASPTKATRTAKAKAVPRDVPGPGSPTLRSQAQLEIRLERGARALTATEQAARLASAQMERRIGRLLSRRVKLKFRS